jgi:hypothetical protein
MSDTNEKSVTGTPGKSKVISVQGNDINKVINAQTGGQAPNQNTPSGNQQPPKQSGGGPEGAAKVDPSLKNAVAPPTASVNTTATGTAGTVPDNDDIDIEKMISTSEGEVKSLDQETKKRQEITDKLQTALAARGRFERLLFNNIETGEMVGTKLRYLKDNDGKTIYDYMNDPVVQEHIEFIAAEGDPMDGSPVDRQVTFYWKKPTF